MPRKSGKRKKTRTHVVEDTHAQSALSSNDASLKIPKSVVVRRGKVESEVQELIHDIRKLMSPHTALKLNDSLTRKLKLSDYAKQLSGPMGVTHILAFSQNKTQLNLRIARTPSGPTLSFKVHQFSLSQHIRKIQRKPVSVGGVTFQHSPIVVTNNFGDRDDVGPHVKLMRITFQNMFPAVNVATVKLADCRRVVLFNLINKKINQNKDNETNDNNNDEGGEEYVEIRHYAIRATPVGINRKVRKLVQCKLPNLKNLNDVSDYILGSNSVRSNTNGNMSEGMSDSEAEDETSHVVLPQKYNGRGNSKSQKSALKLVELGPRLKLKLIKVERGLGEGDVMYHSFVKKTPEEARQLKRRVEDKADLKKRRREEQEANVARKQHVKDEKKERKRLRKEEKDRLVMEELRNGGGVGQLTNDAEDSNDSPDEYESDDTSGEKEDSNQSENDSESYE